MLLITIPLTMPGLPCTTLGFHKPCAVVGPLSRPAAPARAPQLGNFPGPRTPSGRPALTHKR